ncbi:MAG: YidC/Oxa1 family membrane protein insertase [Parcubacteria bacterium C7867-005]|nr:MAG: YidC/Oxa1 family membrane protein insertase [Parcubacteria bacterium C7867-005]
MSALYHSLIFYPLYNTLVGLFTLLPWADAGIVVILLTLIVRLALFPLSKKAVLTQVRMQQINPELKEIKERYKDNQEEQARKTLALYKEKGVNPFSGIFVLLIQLPIIFALYGIFLHAGFPGVDSSILYSFVHAPDEINTMFLGLINITEKSVVLAFFAAVTTFFQLKLATGGLSNKSNNPNEKKSFGEDLAQSMQTQMKYIFPVLVFFISYKISGVIALYWLTSNLFTIGQEIVVRRNIPKTT